VMDDVLFNQWGILAGATGIHSTTSYSRDSTEFVPIMKYRNANSPLF
jgi:hypothetical protein